MTEEQIDYTALYEQTVSGGAPKAEDIVSVKAPSGFVFQFLRPSKHFMMFRLGRLPQNATQKAIKGWLEAAGEEGEIAKKALPADADVTAIFEIRDYVLDRSYKPKLVVGEARNPGELSTDKVSGEDLDFLLRWVAVGGESDMLDRFPGGSGSNALASAAKPKRRAKAK